jgi:membrane protease YdiL (CAAX protease family)
MGRRLNALLEVILVFILILLVPILSTPVLMHLWLWPRSLTIFTYLVYAAFILILLVVTRRDFSRTQIPSFIFNTGSIEDLLIYYSGQLIILFVIAKLLISVPDKDNKVARGALIIIPAIYLLLMSAAIVFMSGLISNVIYYMVETLVIVGPVEELLYRGYMQSRLNEAFGRPHRFFGVSWGAGSIIASALFGIWHLFKYPFNPLLGNYSLSFISVLGAFFFGLTMGFIREKTGSIVAPAILHSVFDFVMQYFVLFI